MKEKKSSKTKIFIFIGLLISMMLLSELFYALRNKWVLYSYTLIVSKLLNRLELTDAAFYLSTGLKYKLPNNDLFIKDVSEKYKSLPDYFNLPAYLYFFGVSAYEYNLKDLTPKLIELAIKMDPDFSFWRVELANYYLSQGKSDTAEKTIVDCVKLQHPRNHCEDFMNTYIQTRQTYDVGFLTPGVMDYYKLNNP